MSCRVKKSPQWKHLFYVTLMPVVMEKRHENLKISCVLMFNRIKSAPLTILTTSFRKTYFLQNSLQKAELTEVSVTGDSSGRADERSTISFTQQGEQNVRLEV